MRQRRISLGFSRWPIIIIAALSFCAAVWVQCASGQPQGSALEGIAKAAGLPSPSGTITADEIGDVDHAFSFPVPVTTGTTWQVNSDGTVTFTTPPDADGVSAAITAQKNADGSSTEKITYSNGRTIDRKMDANGTAHEEENDPVAGTTTSYTATPTVMANGETIYDTEETTTDAKTQRTTKTVKHGRGGGKTTGEITSTFANPAGPNDPVSIHITWDDEAGTAEVDTNYANGTTEKTTYKGTTFVPDTEAGGAGGGQGQGQGQGNGPGQAPPNTEGRWIQVWHHELEMPDGSKKSFDADPSGNVLPGTTQTQAPPPTIENGGVDKLLEELEKNGLPDMGPPQEGPWEPEPEAPELPDLPGGMSMTPGQGNGSSTTPSANGPTPTSASGPNTGASTGNSSGSATTPSSSAPTTASPEQTTVPPQTQPWSAGNQLAGQKLRSNLTLTNGCKHTHTFTITVAAPFLNLMGVTHVTVPGKKMVSLPAEFDTTGLPLGFHAGLLTIHCDDCAEIPPCVQDKKTLAPQVTIVAPPVGTTPTEDEPTPNNGTTPGSGGTTPTGGGTTPSEGGSPTGETTPTPPKNSTISLTNMETATRGRRS